MKDMKDDSVHFTLTDIPYDAVSRKSNGLRVLDKGKADILTFDLNEFLEEVYRLSQNSCVIFCGKEQFSFIYEFFANKKGTVRSEEHTSELQSRFDLVCRLLLEKKNKSL